MLNIEYYINLLKILLYIYRRFNNKLLAKFFDHIFLKTIKTFNISKADLYSKIIM